MRARSYSGDFIEEKDYGKLINAHNKAVRTGRSGLLEGAGDTGVIGRNLTSASRSFRKVARQRDREFALLADAIGLREQRESDTRQRAEARQAAQVARQEAKAAKAAPAPAAVPISPPTGAAPPQELYSLPRKPLPREQPPKEVPLSDRILETATALRNGTPYNQTGLDANDMAMAESSPRTSAWTSGA